MQLTEQVRDLAEKALQKAVDSHKLEIHYIEAGCDELTITAFYRFGFANVVEVKLSLGINELKEEGLI